MTVLTCPVCGDSFKPTTRHVRIYCSIDCGHTVARRRYRAKPEKKVMIADYERARRHRVKERA